MDVTNRAALQIRGVSPAQHHSLMKELVALGLSQAEPHQEVALPLVVNPDWQPGDLSMSLAKELLARRDELPELPGKIGFAIDAGRAPALMDVSADFRLERGTSGGLILRAEGRLLGLPVRPEQGVDALIDLARWFASSGGKVAGRMKRHAPPLPFSASEAPATPRLRNEAIASAPGSFHAVPFGRIEVATLLAVLDERVEAVRLTPWRGLILEGSKAASDNPSDPRLMVNACPGAPACPQSSVITRDLATALAPYVKGLHVSGCAKGCAYPAQAAVVLTGRAGYFDLACDARAGAPPIRSGLSPAQILALYGAR